MTLLSKTLDKMARVYERIPPRLAECLYLAAFSLVLVYDYAFLTRFEREPFQIPYIVGAALAVLVFCIRVLNVKNEGRTYTILSLALLLVGGGYFLFRHSYYFLVLALLIVGARRIEAKKLFALYLLIATAFFVVMFMHFIYVNGYAWGGWQQRDYLHFGSINSTDCQAMILFLLVAFLFVRGKRVGYTDILVLAGIVIWFWSHTVADINMYCSLACLLIAGLMKTGNILNVRLGKRGKQWIGCVLSLSFLALAVAVIALALMYKPENEGWLRLNTLLHQRLETPHKIFGQYPPSLWGSDYVIVGRGYDQNYNFSELYNQYGYTFIDSSYPNILIMHGYLVFAMILGVMTWVSLRYARRGRLYEVLLLAVLAVDFAAESHMKEISCNIWLLLPFAALTLPGKPEAAPGLTEQAGGAGKGRVNNRHSNRKRK